MGRLASEPLVCIAWLLLSAAARASAQAGAPAPPALRPVFAWEEAPACPPGDAPVPRSSRSDTLHATLAPLDLIAAGRWQPLDAAQGLRDVPWEGWRDSATGRVLSVARLPLAAPFPHTEASTYLTDYFATATGHTVRVWCDHCLQIANRCRALAGGRQALITEGAWLHGEPQLAVLWPQPDSTWLRVAIDAPPADSAARPVLRRLVQQVRFR